LFQKKMTDEQSDQDSVPAPTPLEIIPEIEKQVEGKLPKQFLELPQAIQREVLDKVSGATVTISHARWDGSYPPPSIIEGYERVQPGLADRIFRMTESDLAHRHFMEKSLASYMSCGQWFGFILALVALVGSIVLIYTDRQIAGGALSAAIIVPLVTLFVKGQMAANSPPSTNDDTNTSRSKREQPRAPRGKGRAKK
jgi:uncharacterized membrane protein